MLWGLARLAMGEPSITPALVDRLWDERRGLFLDEAQPGGLRPAVETWAALAPLALPDLPEAIGRRLVEEHLLDPRRFWLPVPPPSVSAAEPSFEPGRGPGWKRRYWRGPTWVNAAWLLWLGLRRLGYDARGRRRWRARLGEIVLREGLREYYDPHTGEGLGATRLRLDEPDPRDGRPRARGVHQLPSAETVVRPVERVSGRPPAFLDQGHRCLDGPLGRLAISSSPILAVRYPCA